MVVVATTIVFVELSLSSCFFLGQRWSAESTLIQWCFAHLASLAECYGVPVLPQMASEDLVLGRAQAHDCREVAGSATRGSQRALEWSCCWLCWSSCIGLLLAFVAFCRWVGGKTSFSSFLWLLLFGKRVFLVTQALSVRGKQNGWGPQMLEYPRSLF